MDDGDEKVYLELNLIVHGIVAVIWYCKITLSVSDVLVVFRTEPQKWFCYPQRFEYT